VVTRIKDIFSANLVHLCNNVSLIALPNFYLQMWAIVEILIQILGGYFLLGQPVHFISKTCDFI